MIQIGLLIGIGILGYFFQPIELRLLKDYIEPIEVKKWPRVVYILLLEVLGICLNLIYPLGWTLILYLCFMVVLIFLACFDMKYMLLPSKVIYLGGVLGIIIQGIRCYQAQDTYYLMSGGLGAIMGVGLFALVFYGSKWLLKKEGLGFGDVRLMGLLGLYIGIENLFIMILIASFLAMIAGGILYIIRRKSEAFPFGPFLCAGALVIVLFGEQILSFYYI